MQIVHAVPRGVATRSVLRRIAPRAGFALETLGHAIEYLADEYVHEFGRQPVADVAPGFIDPQVQAIQSADRGQSRSLLCVPHCYTVLSAAPKAPLLLLTDPRRYSAPETHS